MYSIFLAHLVCSQSYWELVWTRPAWWCGTCHESPRSGSCRGRRHCPCPRGRWCWRQGDCPSPLCRTRTWGCGGSRGRTPSGKNNLKKNTKIFFISILHPCKNPICKTFIYCWTKVEDKCFVFYGISAFKHGKDKRWHKSARLVNHLLPFRQGRGP